MPDSSESSSSIRDYHPTWGIISTTNTLPHVVDDTDEINRRIQYYVTTYGSPYRITGRFVEKEEEPTHNEYGEIAP